MIQPQYLQQQYPQAPSAVSINIYEPKSYGAPAAQQVPYTYTNPMYNIPQVSAWAQQPMGYAQSPYQQYAMPQQQYVPQTITQPYEQPQMPDVQAQQPVEAPVANIVPQQEMPQSAIDTQQPAVNTQMPAVEQGENVPKVNADALLADLKSNDYKLQNEAITSIARFTQSTPDIALQVVTDPIKQALVDIIKTDTSSLPNLTKEQEDISARKDKGETITPEEQALLDKSSPRILADTNRMIALFTLAMVQKLSRDNIGQYSKFDAEQGNQTPVKIGLKDLIGYNEIVNTIQNDPNPQIKAGAIQALQYIAQPEDKNDVTLILQGALNDTDATVKQAAQDAINKLSNEAADTTAQQEQQKVA